MELIDFIKAVYPIYAHTGQNGSRNELLEEHIARCYKYFERLDQEKEILKTLYQFLNKLGLDIHSTAWELAAEIFNEMIFFHDLGKARPSFQKHVMKNAAIEKEHEEENQDTEHSLLSSVIYLDYYLSRLQKVKNLTKLEKRIIKRLMWENAFIISRHHSNLTAMDYYLESFKTSIKRLIVQIKAGSIYGLEELQYFTLESIGKNVGQYVRIRGNTKREQDICFYFYNRFTYSILVTCDYYATTDFSNNLEIQEFGNASYETYHKEYEQTKIMQQIRAYEREKYPSKDLSSIKEMNDLRCEIFLDAEKALESTTEDIIFLEAPTGAGKSNIAINLSFSLLQEKKKLFYIYPFNTLVDQNIQSLNKIFENNKEIQDQITVVNSITPMKSMRDDQNSTFNYYQKVLLDRQFLNYPFVLSTHISLFSYMFSEKREDVFAFHQLMDSVVVLDEIQSYRNTIWAEIIIFLKVCAEVLGIKIIIMSATLPSLEYLVGSESNVKHLLTDTDRFFKHPLFSNRVKVSYELMEDEITLEVLKDKVIQHKGKKLLITFIKKKTANLFYSMICQEDLGSTAVKLITGIDSMYDREQILEPIRNNQIMDVILVSTQLIEAGVDIDMDVGFKDISKLDSEEQFLGRINRSCKNNGLVYFFDLDDPSLVYGDDYRISNEELTLINKDMRSLLEEKKYNIYYQKVMQMLKENKNESTNSQGLNSFFNESVKTLNFPAVEQRMRLISEDTWTMSVVLCRSLGLESGEVLDGEEIWNSYKNLLENNEIDYAEKRVKLSYIKSRLSYFIYQVKKNSDLIYNDMIGELICIFDGDQYFENGKLMIEKLEGDGILFLE